MRTQVAIIGAGPAGLVLAHLLTGSGIDCVVVDDRSRAYVEARLRAGILEQATVDLLDGAGVGGRLRAQGLEHRGVHLQWPGTRHRVDLHALTGRSVWVYGQTEVVKDLIAARLAAGAPLLFEVSGTAVHDLDTGHPSVTFTDSGGSDQRLDCDVVVGTDGFHGVSRPAVEAAAGTARTWSRDYPYAWLGILADVAPSTDELIYAWHPRGFAMHSMRSPSVSRLYLQVPATERIEAWSDDRIWSELSTRLALDGWTLASGPVREKGITPMRSFVSAPMRHGRLFLAGDAAHIVPPTGAKGLNLAIADVALLAEALSDLLGSGDAAGVDSYSERALRRVWRTSAFSHAMTSMLHTTGDAFDAEVQLAQLAQLRTSEAAATVLAQGYTGLPHETRR